MILNHFVMEFFQVDPFDIFDAFFGGSDGLFGERDGTGGINLNNWSGRNQSLDIQYETALLLIHYQNKLNYFNHLFIFL